MRPIHLAALLLLALIWGSSFMLIKVMLEEMTPAAIGWSRLGGGAALILALAAARRPTLPRSFAHWRDVTAVALVSGALPLFLIPWGEQQIPSNLAAILNGAVPIWTVVLAVVLATLGYAAGSVITRRRLQGADSTLLAGSQSLIAFAMLLPFVVASGEVPDFAALSGRVLMATAALAFLSQGVAMIIYFWLLKNVEATQVVLVTYLAPVAAIGWGWLVLDERLELALIPGLALILAGMMLANRRPRPIPVAVPATVEA
ncbi:MAG: hypothetical protein CVU47_09920 [Chloroflexi bacterium HGW-Chloroflexi-9]|nr:MAG: hypothetical protein CVU47_09920 [Chloroflexi bacterium HGW-Chloroflexi-9]